MKSLKLNCVNTIATGFVVLVLISLPLFWARWLCKMFLNNTYHTYHGLNISLDRCGFLPPDLVLTRGRYENDFSANAKMKPGEMSFLGISDYFEARKPGGRLSNISYYDKYKEREKNWVYFDKQINQVVCHYTDRENLTDKMPKEIKLYAGPEGVSEIADKKLGRFFSPIIDLGKWDWRQALIIYDQKSRRFLKINFAERTIIKGPQFSKDDTHKPVKIGLKRKNPSLFDLQCDPAKIIISRQEAEKKADVYKYASDYYINSLDRNYGYSTGQYLPVLDKSGRIDLLDRETLEFAGIAGHLPTPPSFFPSRKFVTPKDLLAYEFFPLALDTDHKYRGMFVASVCREETEMALTAFDENGKFIKQDYSEWGSGPKYYWRYKGRIPLSRNFFFEEPWGPTLAIAKLLFENLQPPILSIVSYFTAYSFEAASGYRALFILPNSFIAMKGRDVSGNIADRLITAILLILPSIILSMLLAWQVSVNANDVGLPRNVRLFWIIATFSFGLTGYITYRLIQPKITLVTCANCGKPRRPDMDNCHRCGSKWDVPELIPPVWRVLNGAE